MTDGFSIPFLKLLHCDSMRIYTKSVMPNCPDLKLGMMGLGAIVTRATFTHGFEHGCKTAQILAINDDGMCFLCFPTLSTFC